MLFEKAIEILHKDVQMLRAVQNDLRSTADTAGFDLCAVVEEVRKRVKGGEIIRSAAEKVLSRKIKPGSLSVFGPHAPFQLLERETRILYKKLSRIKRGGGVEYAEDVQITTDILSTLVNLAHEDEYGEPPKGGRPLRK